MSEVARPNSGLPRGILIGAAVLIAFAVATTLFGRVSDIGTLHMPAATAVQTLSLQFEDRDDGSVAVHDATDGAVIYVVDPGVGGFIRATMRGMARERRRNDVGEQPPFLLTRWSDGTISLVDKTTGRSISLDAFGATNAGAFAQLFTSRETVK
jgi:putative photosynthetic complex assembly protein